MVRRKRTAKNGQKQTAQKKKCENERKSAKTVENKRNCKREQYGTVGTASPGTNCAKSFFAHFSALFLESAETPLFAQINYLAISALWLVLKLLKPTVVGGSSNWKRCVFLDPQGWFWQMFPFIFEIVLQKVLFLQPKLWFLIFLDPKNLNKVTFAKTALLQNPLLFSSNRKQNCQNRFPGNWLTKTRSVPWSSGLVHFKI